MNREHYKNVVAGALYWNAWAKNQGSGFRADLEKAYLQYKDLARTNLEKAHMKYVQLEHADLTDAVLFLADLSEANLNHTTLVRTHLSLANLEDANLMLANLEGAKLFGANLTNTNFAARDLENADLRQAKLDGTIFSNASMQGVQVSTAKTFTGLDLPFCDLRHVRGLTQEQVDTMSGDSGTLLPEHLKHPAHWPSVPEDVLPNLSGLGLFSTTPETDQPTAFKKPITPTHADSRSPEKPASKIDISPLTPQQVAWMMGATGNTDALDATRKIASDRFVFLYYKREDRPWVQSLRDTLIHHGIPVWWDDDIPYGQNWDHEIDTHLEAAEIVLTVWTDKSVASREVKNEALYGAKNNKLVQVQTGNPKLPPRYQAIQCADLTAWRPSLDHPNLDRLIDELRRRLSI